MGMRLGRELQRATLALSGDLGAGKTVLSRALCLGAGIDSNVVSSPTFTLINQYVGGRVLVHHMDTYRLDPESFVDLGIDEILAGEGLKIIEWAERIEEFLPRETLHVTIEHAGATERDFSFYSADEKWTAVIEALLK